MTLSNTTILKIAAFGGVAAALAVEFFAGNKINHPVRDTEFYQEALKALRNHEIAILVLGKYAKEGLIDFQDKMRNFTNFHFAHYEVPVKGSERSGTLHIYANRRNPKCRWYLYIVDLQVENATLNILSATPCKTLDPLPSEWSGMYCLCEYCKCT